MQSQSSARGCPSLHDGQQHTQHSETPPPPASYQPGPSPPLLRPPPHTHTQDTHARTRARTHHPSLGRSPGSFLADRLTRAALGSGPAGPTMLRPSAALAGRFLPGRARAPPWSRDCARARARVALARAAATPAHLRQPRRASAVDRINRALFAQHPAAVRRPAGQKPVHHVPAAAAAWLRASTLPVREARAAPRSKDRYPVQAS